MLRAVGSRSLSWSDCAIAPARNVSSKQASGNATKGSPRKTRRGGGTFPTLRISKTTQALGLFAVFALTVAAGAISYLCPDVRLRPIAYVLVLAAAALGGYRWGLALGAFATLIFTILDVYSGYSTLSLVVWTNALFFFAAVVASVILVELVRTRTQSEAAAQFDLARAKEQVEHLTGLRETRSALYQMQQRYAAISDVLPYGTWLTNADGSKLLYASENYCRLFGMSVERIADNGFRSRVPPDDYERFIAAWRNRTEDGIFENEYRVLGVDGNMYSILSRGVRLTDNDGVTTGWAGFSLDITGRKQSEEKVALLSQLGRVLSTSLDPQRTLARAAELVVPRLADWCAIDLVSDAGEIRRALMVHSDPALTAQAQELIDAGEAARFGHRAEEAIATGRPQLHEPVGDEEIDASVLSRKQRTLLKRFGLGHAVTVPLIARQQTFGALTLVSTGAAKAYSQEDADFAGIIARRVALAYDNARLYEREHRVADIFQRASLPTSMPELPGITLRAHYVPGAKEAEIGGDWYDAFTLPDGRLGVSIGDVAGKGLQAAAAMSAVRLLIRATALEHLTPSNVLARANLLLLNDRPSMVTALFGFVDLENMTFSFACAGHPPPIVASPDGSITFGQPVAPPLGVSPEAEFPEQSLALSHGSLLVLYTDGLVEQNRNAIPNGEERLLEAIRSILATHESNAAWKIVSMLTDSEPKDDIAVLTIACAPAPLREMNLELPAKPLSSRIFRQSLRRLFVAAGMTEENIQLFQVALGEAITNCIQHAYGVQGGTVRVWGRVEKGKLVVDVSDSGRWRAPHGDGGGYGLNVIRAIAKKVSIQRSSNGTTIRFIEPLGGSND